MRRAGREPIIEDMAESSLQRREVALKLAVAAFVLAAVAAILIWDPSAGLVRGLDLPDSLPDVPDVPKWLLFLVGKGKLILIAVIVALVAAGRWHARRRRNSGTGEARMT
jgi:hypothetical protein